MLLFMSKKEKNGWLAGTVNELVWEICRKLCCLCLDGDVRDVNEKRIDGGLVMFAVVVNKAVVIVLLVICSDVFST